MILDHQNLIGGYKGAHRKRDHQLVSATTAVQNKTTCVAVPVSNVRNLLYHCHTVSDVYRLPLLGGIRIKRTGGSLGIVFGRTAL
jgi:hypothetical protein